jgi:hypothetical protein
VKKTIAEVEGNGYTFPQKRPDQIKGLREEVKDGIV